MFHYKVVHKSYPEYYNTNLSAEALYLAIKVDCEIFEIPDGPEPCEQNYLGFVNSKILICIMKKVIDVGIKKYIHNLNEDSKPIRAIELINKWLDDSDSVLKSELLAMERILSSETLDEDYERFLRHACRLTILEILGEGNDNFLQVMNYVVGANKFEGGSSYITIFKIIIEFFKSGEHLFMV